MSGMDAASTSMLEEGAFFKAPSFFLPEREKSYSLLKKTQVLNLPLLESQTRSVAHLAALRYGLLFDDMGMGKTAQALAMGTFLKYQKILILCPNILKDVWIEQILKFTNTKISQIYTGSGQEMNFHRQSLKGRFKYFIFNYEALRASSKGGKVPDIFEGPLDMVICDEAHNIKNPDTQTYITLYKSCLQYPPKSMLLMTGTPFDRCIIEAWSYLSLMAMNPELKGKRTFQDVFKNPAHFGDIYAESAGEKVKVIEGDVYSIPQYQGYQIKREAELKMMLNPLVVRREISDIVELPKLYTTDYFFEDYRLEEHMDTTVSEATEKFEKAMGFVNSKNFQELQIQKKLAGKSTMEEATLAVAMKYRAKIAKAKAALTVEVLNKINFQTVIFSEFIAPLEKLVELLTDQGDTFRVVTGQMKRPEQDLSIDQWKKGKAKYLLATFGVLSEGANLQEGQGVFFNDMPWQPSRIAQAQRRVWRIGQKKVCFFGRNLCSADQFVLDILERKDIMIASTNRIMRELQAQWQLLT